MRFALKHFCIFSSSATLILALCGFSIFESSKIKAISDEEIKNNIGDFKGVYKAWFTPYIKNGFWSIPFDKSEETQATEEVLKKGFIRFCTESGWQTEVKNTQYKDNVVCTSSQGDFMGQFTIERIMDSDVKTLKIYYDTKEARAIREKQVSEIQSRLNSLDNGPTGWITTTGGRYRFARIGTLEKRFDVEIQTNDEYTPIDKIKSINRLSGERIGDIKVTKKNGGTFITDYSKYVRREKDERISPVGVLSSQIGRGMAFVLIDQVTGLTYQEYFDGNKFYGQRDDYRLKEKILSIEIDDEQAWKGLPGSKLLDGYDYLKLTSTALPVDELTRLINKFENNDPKKLVPNAKKILASIKNKESIKPSVEKPSPQSKDTTLKQYGKIGDQICLSINSTFEQPTNLFVLGKQQFNLIEGVTRIVGFIENSNPETKKIQIRISGINFSAGGVNESLDSFKNFKGGSKLLLNSVIWDSSNDWNTCS